MAAGFQQSGLRESREAVNIRCLSCAARLDIRPSDRIPIESPPGVGGKGLVGRFDVWSHQQPVVTGAGKDWG
ncbi:hypothetical protein OPT61_g1028 [Boeremia exigua]|uniref:Uncharacterized protein n=1 Tax=Boeremia exigua TaxID=749465 RepID=A0ACC2IRN0_9PLEO|nr:hypothetical protein OPT61_g1028 [Boeremia exigua]